MAIERAHRTGGKAWRLRGHIAPTEGLVFERAHRTSRKTDRDRTIVVKFASFKARDAVIQAARAVKSRGVYITEDFSMHVVNRRKELFPEMRAAREHGKLA